MQWIKLLCKEFKVSRVPDWLYKCKIYQWQMPISGQSWLNEPIFLLVLLLLNTYKCLHLQDCFCIFAYIFKKNVILCLCRLDFTSLFVHELTTKKPTFVKSEFESVRQHSCGHFFKQFGFMGREKRKDTSPSYNGYFVLIRNKRNKVYANSYIIMPSFDC